MKFIQKLIRIIRISALTFMSSTGTFDLIFYNCLRFLRILNWEGVLPKFCIDIDVFLFMNILLRFCMQLFIRFL